ISYGDFLVNNTYKYEEAKGIIESLNLSSLKIKSAEDWVRFFEETIYREKTDMRLNQITDQMMECLIQIPNRPKDYYKGEWISWEDFLGLEIESHNKTLTLTKDNKASGS